MPYFETEYLNSINLMSFLLFARDAKSIIKTLAVFHNPNL